MSEPTPTESPRLLRSPFNGEAWPVPPEVDAAMYDALLKAGYTPIPDKTKRKEVSRERV